MKHHRAAADDRSVSEIMAEARRLQARHAGEAVRASARWLRGAVARLGGRGRRPAFDGSYQRP